MKEYKVTHRCLIILALFFILLFAGLMRYIILKNNLFNVYDTKTSYKQVVESNNQAHEIKQQTNIKSYTANVIIQLGKEKEYKIGDSFSIKVRILNIDDDIVNYNFSINNSEYYNFDTIKINEGYESFEITVYKMGRYYIFENTGINDSRDTHIYIFDEFGKIYKDLYRIGNTDDNELYIESIKFNENEFIINTSRTTDDFQIIYGNNLYNVYDKDVNIVPNETPVKIQYKYVTNESGIIDFTNPESRVLETFGDFIKRNN